MDEKILIIAEKPSVAGDLCKVLPGKFKKHKTYYESDTHIVSYAVGHLVTICHPEEINEHYKPWKLDNLPILPEEFPLKSIPNTKGQLSALRKLLKRRDVVEIINACDAGREGELIFKYILDFAGSASTKKKPIKRLWLQSMTAQSIKDGFKNLRDNADMQNLTDAAMCRSESDWLIGINASRAMTAYKSKMGGFFLTPCGRVQTPTLSLIVNRENERKAFISQDYWEDIATFTVDSNNQYKGRWFDIDFKKSDENPHNRAERIWDKQKATQIANDCKNKTATVEETQKPSSQRSPQLFDLTSLQREANSKFGFSAKNSLGLAQSLYERHKALTYPRTDSRCLPEDYVEETKKLMENISNGKFGKFAKTALKNKYVKIDKRIFNNKKISDHFAIIPTGTIPNNLSEPEQKIFDLVTQRFLAVFFPPAIYLNTKRITTVDTHKFLTEGKVLQEPGWKSIYGNASDEEATLCPINADSKILCDDVEVIDNATRPPARYTESTLLGAMEHSNKFVDDEELADALKDNGLGTPATRASIIEGLLKDKYLARDGRELVPTGKAFDLLNHLEAMNINELSSPELTGEWENKLKQILIGDYTRDEFMSAIRKQAASIAEKVKGFDEDVSTRKEASFSPLNGVKYYDSLSRFKSEDEKIIIRKILGGRIMEEHEIVELITKRKLGPMDGFRSKKGKPFNATIILTDENKVEFIFANTAKFSAEEVQEIKKTQPLGNSPIDGTPVYETSVGYLSESALDEMLLDEVPKKSSALRITKIILEVSLSPEHIKKLLNGEKTELIKGFKSARTRRLFDAFLSMDKKGKIKFDFPPRVPRNKKKTTSDEK